MLIMLAKIINRLLIYTNEYQYVYKEVSFKGRRECGSRDAVHCFTKGTMYNVNVNLNRVYTWGSSLVLVVSGEEETKKIGKIGI